MLYKIAINKLLDNDEEKLNEKYFVVESPPNYILTDFVYLHGPSKSTYEIDKEIGNFKIFRIETESHVSISKSRKENFTSKSSKKIFVSKQIIISNNQKNLELPICTIEDKDTTYQATLFEIKGPCKLLYDKNKSPRIWIETDSEIISIQ